MVWDGGLDARYRDALTRPHRSYGRVEVTDYQGNLLLGDLPFVDGNVRASLSSRVARTLDLTLTREWFPATPTGGLDYAGLLAPVGNRLRVFWGLLYGDGSAAEFPCFYGRVETPKRGSGGTCTVTASDLAADVVDGGFLVPTNSVPSNSIGAEYRRLILQAVPDATFGPSDNDGPAIGQLTWATDRARALDDMTASLGQTWWPLADGQFVRRATPWTQTGRTPDVTLSDGTGPAPLLTDYQIGFSRVGVANAANVTAERQDGTAPVDAQVFDQDPTSPTLWGGPFGKKPRVVSVQSALTQPQVVGAAHTQLNLARSLSLTWESVQMIPDGSLELGDCVLAVADGVVSIQIISGFSLPLREGGTMPLSLRAYSPLGVV